VIHTEREPGREPERERERESQRERESESQRDRQRERKRERETERDRERQRERGTGGGGERGFPHSHLTQGFIWHLTSRQTPPTDCTPLLPNTLPAVGSYNDVERLVFTAVRE
jgi:hypothetical protein